MESSIIIQAVSESLLQLTLPDREIARELIYDFVKVPSVEENIKAICDILPACILLIDGQRVSFNHKCLRRTGEDIIDWVIHTNSGLYHCVDYFEALAGLSTLLIPDRCEVAEEIKKREKFLSSIIKLERCVKSVYPGSNDKTFDFLSVVKEECQSHLVALYYYDLLNDGLELKLSPATRGKLVGVLETMRA